MLGGRAPLRDVWRRNYSGCAARLVGVSQVLEAGHDVDFRFDYRHTTTYPPAPHLFHAVNVALHALCWPFP